MVYGFNKKSTAEKLSEIAKSSYSEQSTRRRVTDTSELPRNSGIRQFFATPKGTIPSGTQINPGRGEAYLLRLNTQTEMMERTEAIVEVWNTGPELLDNGNGGVTPLVRLWGDSHGRLWVVQETVHVIFTAPDTGIPGGQTVECTPVDFSDGRTVAAGDMIMVENRIFDTVCETGSHQGTAVTWQDHYLIINEARECM